MYNFASHRCCGTLGVVSQYVCILGLSYYTHGRIRCKVSIDTNTNELPVPWAASNPYAVEDQSSQEDTKLEIYFTYHGTDLSGDNFLVTNVFFLLFYFLSTPLSKAVQQHLWSKRTQNGRALNVTGMLIDCKHDWLIGKQ